MAEKRERYYKNSKKWRDHEQQMALIKFLEETCKSDPEFKYFLGAAGGFGLAALGAFTVGASSYADASGSGRIPTIDNPDYTGAWGIMRERERYAAMTDEDKAEYDRQVKAQRAADMSSAFEAFKFLQGGGSIAAIGGLTFGSFCFLMLILKNLDGVAEIVKGVGEIVPF